MLSITTIASGSTGNCYRISDGVTTIMIECGIRFQLIREAFNFQLSSVSACLISHEHQDHCKSIKHVVKAGIDCYLSQGTAEKIGIASHRIRYCLPGTQFTVGTFTIMSFDTQHDAAQPVGFLIKSGNNKLLFATDTYYLKYRFKSLTHIMIECNYSKDTLYQNIDAGLVPLALKNRLIESHFEFENVKTFLLANDLSKVREIHLIHISDGNGDPELFRDGVQKITGLPVYVFGKNNGI